MEITPHCGCHGIRNEASPLLKLPPETRNRIWSLISEDTHFQLGPDLENGRLMREYNALQSMLRTCKQICNEAAPYLTISATFTTHAANVVWPPPPLRRDDPPSAIAKNHYVWTTVIPMMRFITMSQVELGDTLPLSSCVAPLLDRAKSLEVLVVGNFGLYGIQPWYDVESKDEIYDFLHGRHSQQETSLDIQAKETMQLLGYDMCPNYGHNEDNHYHHDRYASAGWQWLLELMHKDTLPFRLCVKSVLEVRRVSRDESSGKKVWDAAPLSTL